jgi:isopentenyl diphosphate isomerase/L-lactate dehydrogenase-like FMN-dependent dehydrogenase
MTSYEVPHLLVSSITQLPVILKGILTADDATIAADLGVAAIVVSNHGARQVDGTPASVSMDIVQRGCHTNKLQTYF